MSIKPLTGSLVLFTNTFTNIFALVPVFKLYKKKHYGGSILLLCSFTASCLMHITETKHGLRPRYLKEYSNLFLNIDRVFGVLVFLYFTRLALQQPINTLIPILVRFVIGAISSFIGEVTTDLYWYLALHTVWHYCAFTAVGCVVNLL
jgi:hypothetical protein